jgi:hypothetical protein
MAVSGSSVKLAIHQLPDGLPCRVGADREEDGVVHKQHRQNKLQYVHFDACDSKDLAKITGNPSLSAVLFSTLAELAPTPPEASNNVLNITR